MIITDDKPILLIALLNIWKLNSDFVITYKISDIDDIKSFNQGAYYDRQTHLVD